MQRMLWLPIMLAWLPAPAIGQQSRDLNPERYRAEMDLFRKFDARNTLPSRPILFIGSSSISFWETASGFPEYPIVNRGLGGSVFPDLLYYYDDIVRKYKPAVVVIYCDNDVLFGSTPETALRHFKELSGKIIEDFPRAHVVFLSMKPTPDLDAAVRATLDTTNRMFESFAGSRPNLHYVDVATSMLDNDGKVKPDIFLPDREHLTPQAYETLWNPIVRTQLSKLYKR